MKHKTPTPKGPLLGTFFPTPGFTWGYSNSTPIGVDVFGEIFPFIESFFNSTHMGSINLPSLIDFNYGLVLLIVIILAILDVLSYHSIDEVYERLFIYKQKLASFFLD